MQVTLLWRVQTWLKRATESQRGPHVLRLRNCHISWPAATQVVIILAFFLYNEWVDGDHEVQGPRLQLT